MRELIVNVNSFSRYQFWISITFLLLSFPPMYLDLVTGHISCEQEQLSCEYTLFHSTCGKNLTELCMPNNERVLTQYLKDRAYLNLIVIALVVLYGLFNVSWSNIYRNNFKKNLLKRDFTLEELNDELKKTRIVKKYHLYMVLNLAVLNLLPFAINCLIFDDFTKFGLIFLNGASDEIFPPYINCSNKDVVSKCNLLFNGWFKFAYMIMWILVFLSIFLQSFSSVDLLISSFSAKFRQKRLRSKLNFLDEQTLRTLARNRQIYFFLDLYLSKNKLESLFDNQVENLRNNLENLALNKLSINV